MEAIEKLYFLGPKGTYSEVASEKIKDILNFKNETVEISTITKIAQLVNQNPTTMAIMPIENSIEGIVRPTIDSLYSTDVKIQAQIDIKVEHCIASFGKKEEIKHIVSHPQALAQCSLYISQEFDENIELISANSTSEALHSLLNKDKTYAAIGRYDIAKKLNLNIINTNIGDIKENRTRFVLVSKTKIPLKKDDRTSIVFNTKNESGALLKILEIFKKYNLNLVYIESRPSKKVFGEYNFFVDVDKGYDEIIEAISEIKKECNFYKLLGSYPVIR